MSDKIRKSAEEWQAQLSSEQYYVTREGATEMAFSGKYYDLKEPGIYHCVCCGTPLFSSQAKYDSGSGWPSFWQAVAADRIELHPDSSHGMQRTEIRCARCDAHLGHVFNDGPQPTGQRYCVNSASLDFRKRD